MTPAATTWPASSQATAAVTSAPAVPDPAITELPDWTRYLGDGVDARPYGLPSKFEKDVIRRDVEWLRGVRAQ